MESNVKMFWRRAALMLSAVAFLIAGATACLKEEAPYLNLSVENAIQIGSSGGSVKVEVTTNQGWQATSNVDWCTVVGGSGSYYGDFSVSVDENTSPSFREATVTVTAGGVVKTITITQTVEDVDFSLSTKSILFLNSADTYKLTVVSNHPWTATSSSPWCTLSSSTKTEAAEISGDGDDLITVSATANDTGEDREGTITFMVKTDGEYTIQTVEVRQGVSEFYLELPVTEYSVSRSKGTLDIAYLLAGVGVDVQCETDSPDWLTLGNAADGRLLVTFAENTSGTERTGRISFNTAGQAGKPEIRYVTVNQAAVKNVLDLMVSAVDVSPEGEALSLSVSGNVEIAVASSSAWLQATATGSTVTVEAASNLTGLERLAYVTVTSQNGDLGDTITKVLTVRQNAISNILTLPLGRFSVDSNAEMLAVPFVAYEGVTLDCVTDANWLYFETTEDNAAVFTVDQNYSSEVREAVIAFTAIGAGEPVVREVYVTQKALEHDLSVLYEEITLDPDGETVKIPFYADLDFDLMVSSDWCTVTQLDAELEITADLNIAGSTRTAYVTLSAVTEGGETMVASLKVTQEPANVVFEFETPTVTMDWSSSKGYAQILSTGAWVLNNTAAELPRWLTITPTEGEGDALLTLTVTENEFIRERKTQLSFTNTLQNRSIVLVVVQDGNPNGIESYGYLGAGYDAAGEYASDQYVRASILDMNLLMDYGYLSRVITLNSTEERYTYGKTVEEYQTALSQSASVSGSYKGFSASVSNSFSRQTLSSKENEYATFRHMTKKQSFKIDPSLKAADLKKTILPDVQDEIDNMDPERLFAKYGTHVLTGYVLGGSLDFAMSADASVMAESVDWGIAVSGGFQFLKGGVEATAEFESYNAMRTEAANFESSLKARGGESQYTSTNPTAGSESMYNSWLQSLEDKSKWVMVDYDGSMLIPIWEFASTTARKAALETAAKEYLKTIPISQNSTHRTLTLQVMKLGYQGDDGALGGSTVETSFTWKFSLNGGAERTLSAGSSNNQIDLKEHAPKDDPDSDRWLDVEKNNYTIKFEDLSIYKAANLFITQECVEYDGSSGDDKFSGNTRLLYAPGDQSWRLGDSTSNAFDIVDGTFKFTLVFGDGMSLIRATWDVQ